MESNSFEQFSKFNTYWFCRDLISSEFGGFASKETDVCIELSETLLDTLDKDSESLQERLDTVEGQMLSCTREGTKRHRKTAELVKRVRRRINNISDLRSLAVSLEATAKTTKVLDNVREFSADEIIEIVDETITEDNELNPKKAYDALYNVDLAGEQYQLASQREGIVSYVSELRDEVPADQVDRITSAVVQEYERRAGNSRVSTAGNVLEIGLQHLFERFELPATGEPEHFGDLEIDNVIRGESGSIGFSCKRTLRERFRQSLTRKSEVGVDEIWFVSLMLADVSRDKLEDIMSNGGRIYVPRDSFVWDKFGNEKELEPVLYPASSFLEDISEYTGNELNRAIKEYEQSTLD